MDMVWRKQTRTHENKWPMRMNEPMSINLKPESVFLWNIHWSLFASRSSIHIVQVASRKAGVLHHGNIQETSSMFYKTEGENLRSCRNSGSSWGLGNLTLTCVRAKIYKVELMVGKYAHDLQCGIDAANFPTFTQIQLKEGNSGKRICSWPKPTFKKLPQELFGVKFYTRSC